MNIEITDEEIKKKVIEKMKENKSLERIEDEYRFGVTLAMDEIQNNSAEDSIDYNPFRDSDKNEILALQFVFQYLKQKGFQFTLSCLYDESNTKYDESLQLIDLKEVILNCNPPLSQARDSYPVEPSKVITKSEFMKFKYIVGVDEL